MRSKRFDASMACGQDRQPYFCGVCSGCRDSTNAMAAESGVQPSIAIASAASRRQATRPALSQSTTPSGAIPSKMKAWRRRIAAPVPLPSSFVHHFAQHRSCSRSWPIRSTTRQVREGLLAARLGPEVEEFDEVVSQGVAQFNQFGDRLLGRLISSGLISRHTVVLNMTSVRGSSLAPTREAPSAVPATTTNVPKNCRASRPRVEVRISPASFGWVGPRPTR